jgi:hypothetical protein
MQNGAFFWVKLNIFEEYMRCGDLAIALDRSVTFDL